MPAQTPWIRAECTKYYGPGIRPVNRSLWLNGSLMDFTWIKQREMHLFLRLYKGRLMTWGNLVAKQVRLRTPSSLAVLFPDRIQ